MNIYRNMACTPANNNVVCLELDESKDPYLLYLPVVFYRQLHNFSSLSSHQLQNSSQEHDMNHLYSGSIVFTHANIFLTLTFLPDDIHSHSSCDGKFRDTDKTTIEVIVFSDIIEAVTGFRRYLTDKADNNECCCYMLELMGGVYSIFFNRDETQLVRPYSSHNTLNEKQNDGNVTVENIVPEWVHRVEELIGEECIELTTRHPSNSNCSDDHHYDDEHPLGVEHTTISWETLRENVRTQLSSTLSTNAADLVELEAQRQCHLNNALAAYISLIHEEHAEMETILLQWISTSIQIKTATGVPKLPKVNLASTSLSLRRHMDELDDSYSFDGRSANITDEVMMLLAEEEMVARMKLEKYTATTQKVKGV
ncbi:uncharacterized protein TM35_000171120 [Trypanosoma theileri]|uniref:Uncharacterized protein n=1 Tax=Trypanosoma theileri TaxID=67003 RepID=A0A1X0NVU2_9TRYP|nr:uncharacterized protein TM35_000171120 [Trypanosoma theileri]ORC88240.1 hypothetical protein TM35_000171120 [Trypanosoma theileri]